jgi:HD-GYP domain-containing protein (c-di-GMP phosphodiesterase class II)
MKKHPVHGVSLCLKLGIKNKNILDGIKYHHEKKNGTGYPIGLSGDEIPLYAMMIGICDIFDALTSKRSYKEAMTSFEALMLMKTQMKDELDIRLLKSMILMFK